MVREVRNLRACSLVTCAVLLAGCGKTYAPPEAGAPSATLTLLRDPAADSNLFQAYYDDACTASPGTGTLGIIGVLHGGPKDVLLGTDARLFVKVVSFASTMGVRTITSEPCGN